MSASGRSGHGLAVPQATTTRILIVDDEEPILFAMREYFATKGYAVDCARETQEAEALLAKNRYALAILDLRLSGTPGAEGLDVIASVRARSRETRIILLTAYGSREIEAEARRRGADAFLQKPKPLAEVAQIASTLMGVA
ncbi:MAG TPA: response regulator [Thermoanaerobaculia bacterium]|nr:response regulator [Thermoanaerobaculia bacterium]